MEQKWTNLKRPGYFGRQRDAIVGRLNAQYGVGGWRLVWIVSEGGIERTCEFVEACERFYEEAYLEHLKAHPEELDFICSHGECQDNAPSNYEKGEPLKYDYADQEAFSTHIQDITVRRVLRRLGREFTGPADKILVIRGSDSDGFRFNPGNVPFHRPEIITSPEIKPGWAKPASVEAFWQSCKWIQVLEHLAPPPVRLRVDVPAQIAP